MENCISHEFKKILWVSSQDKIKINDCYCTVNESKILKILAKRVESEGGKIIDRTKFLSYNKTGNFLKVKTNSKEFKTKLIVDASGFDPYNLNQADLRWNVYAKTYKNVDLRDPNEAIAADISHNRDFIGEVVPLGEDKAMIMIFTMSKFPLDINFSKKCLDYYSKKHLPVANQFRKSKEIDTRFGSVPFVLKKSICLDNLIKVGDSAGQNYHIGGAGFNDSFKFSKIVTQLIIESLENRVYDGDVLTKKYYELMDKNIPMLFYNYTLIPFIYGLMTYRIFVDTGLMTSKKPLRSLSTYQIWVTMQSLYKIDNKSIYKVARGEITQYRDFIFPIIRSVPSLAYEFLRLVALRNKWKPKL